MRGDLQSKINPFTQSLGKDFSATKTKDKDAPTQPRADEADFLNVLNNSNTDVKREREAKKLNGGVTGKETYQEFLDKISDKEKNLRTPKNNLDKDDFLKLFITQLQNQDPLNPEDSTEMASRLAHFNSLEQMLNVNKTLNTMLDTQKQGRSVDLVSYIGKEIQLDGGRVVVGKDGQVSESMFNLARPAVKANLEIRDGSGAVIHSKELGTLNPGEQSLKWDGLRTDGAKAGGGVYTYSITAQGINGEDIPVTMSTRAKVTGVDLQDKNGRLHTNMGAINFDEVKAIGEEGYANLVGPKPAAPTVTDPANPMAQIAEQLSAAIPGGPAVPLPPGPVKPAQVENKTDQQAVVEQIAKQNAQAMALPNEPTTAAPAAPANTEATPPNTTASPFMKANEFSNRF